MASSGIQVRQFTDIRYTWAAISHLTFLIGCKSRLSKVKTKQDISSVAEMLAKSLNKVDHLRTIVTGNVKWMDGETAYLKRTQRMMQTAGKLAVSLKQISSPVRR